MALDGSFTLYDLDDLSSDGDTFTVTVGVALLVLQADGQQPVIGETISFGNPGTGQAETYTVVGSSADGLLLTDGTLAYLLGDAGIPRGTLVQTEANTANAPCFVAGTRILTAQGEKPVEALAPGDLVVALLGRRLASIVWIGRTERAFAHAARDGFPVRVAAGAIADGQPRRDLLLSPDHALLIDGRLVPVRHLVNGASIAHATGMRRATYFHVELDCHDALLADGTPAESFLDTGNRHQFDTTAVRRLFPPAAPDPAAALRIWAERSCAPLLLSGPALAALHHRLCDRAIVLGHELTGDPDLRITVHGTALATLRQSPGSWQAVVPAGVCTVRLVSRSGPAQEIASGLDDRRCLGVALAGLILDGVRIALDAGAPDGDALTSGVHPPEPGCRWTDGSATLRIVPAARPRLLQVDTHAGWRLYWQEPCDDPVARRA